MREIKFRVWLGNRMEYQVLAGRLGTFFAYQDPRDSASAINTKYDKIVLPMQYIGLEDKNGTQIYEGDIVVWKGKGNARKVVEFKNGSFGFKVREQNNWIIIGNIYENPELLTQNNGNK